MWLFKMWLVICMWSKKGKGKEKMRSELRPKLKKLNGWNLWSTKVYMMWNYEPIHRVWKKKYENACRELKRIPVRAGELAECLLILQRPSEWHSCSSWHRLPWFAWLSLRVYVVETWSAGVAIKKKGIVGSLWRTCPWERMLGIPSLLSSSFCFLSFCFDFFYWDQGDLQWSSFMDSWHDI